MSVVNFSSFLSFARSRTRSSPVVTLTRSCARRVSVSCVFPSVPPLRSTGSAPAPSGLFADFIASMDRSDFCGSFVIGFDLFGLPDADRLAAANPQISRFPNKELAYMPGSIDHAGPHRHSHHAPMHISFLLMGRRRRPG